MFASAKAVQCMLVCVCECACCAAAIYVGFGVVQMIYCMSCPYTPVHVVVTTTQ